MARRIVVAITGASGAAYARRLLACLASAGVEIHLIVSPYGRRLCHDELGLSETSPEALVDAEHAASIMMHDYRDVGDVLASGSFQTDGMVLCPCSGNTLGHIAAGLGDTLITRAAAVHLKERRRLILVTREMPVSQIELENMLRVSRAGGILCPASPGFYMMPRTVDDLVDFVAGKLCDLLDVPHDMDTRWDPSGKNA